MTEPLLTSWYRSADQEQNVSDLPVLMHAQKLRGRLSKNFGLHDLGGFSGAKTSIRYVEVLK